MNNATKYIILYISFITILTIILYGTEALRDKNIDFQKEILVKQAQSHFKDQINNRAWNARYGGVFVKPKDGLKPNPYLKNNILKTENGQTLIKINPAWMTRQLSEISQNSEENDFHFRITSLEPINPNNKADEFETRAFKYIEKTLEKEYFEIKDKGDFRYMGALVTTESCLPCHIHQGYKVGDIRGGISINLDTKEYHKIVDYLYENVFLLRIIIASLLLSITLLIHKQFRNNENLKREVSIRTKEILSTKTLLQEVLDSDLSLLMVTDGTDIILANKTMLNFFNVNTLDEFKKEHKYISEAFVEVDNEDYLSKFIAKEHWIDYLEREQNNKELKALMIKDNEERHFKPHSKKILIENRKLHLIIFDEITKELENINELKDKASKDALTNLFNKGKFDDVLTKEIGLSKATMSPFSVLFLDIDHFKIVNDTYGHEAGDYVLKELSKIFINTVRTSDFIARWGGEEFVITLQSTSFNEAAILAEKIRLRVQEYDFKEGGKQTISIGVTQYKYGETKSELMKRVDEALYDAKDNGRNQVVVK